MKTSPESHDPKLTKNRSRDELLKIANDLSNGRYGKESRQRKQILQMIAKELNGTSESPP